MQAIFCGRCGAQNAAGAAFCGRCGARLGVPAAPAAGFTPGAPAWTFAPASGAHLTASWPAKTARISPWLLLGAGVLVLMLALSLAAYLLQPAPPAPPCESRCPPPRGPALVGGKRWTSPSLGFSLDYPTDPHMLPSPNSSDGTSIRWVLNVSKDPYKGVYPFRFQGDKQNNRSPQQIVEALQRAEFRDARPIYSIPGAELGYNNNAFGNVYEFTETPGGGQSVTRRLIIMAAVRNGVSVALVADGPLEPSEGEHANPSRTPLADLYDLLLNTVFWKGDNPP